MNALLLAAIVQAQLSWAPSLQAAKTYAIRTGRPIMLVNQSMTLPGASRSMGDARMGVLSKDFVCVPFHSAEAAATIYKIPAKWQSITAIFVEPSGKLIGRMGGLFLPWAMIESAKQALWARKAEPILRQRIAAGAADPATYARMSIVHAIRGEYEQAEHYLAYAEGAPAQLLGEAYLTLGDQFRVEQRFRESIPPLQKSATLLKDEISQYNIRVRLAGSFIRIEKLDEAEAQIRICQRMSSLTLEQRQVYNRQMERIRGSRGVPGVRSL